MKNKIEIYVEGNILRGKMRQTGGIFANDLFYFYLLKDGAVYARADKWSSSPEQSWTLRESGTYAVQGHVKRDGVNNVYFSHTTLFLMDEDYLKYEEWCKIDEATFKDKIADDVFISSYPYADFLLVSGTEENYQSAKFDMFAHRFGLDVAFIDEFKTCCVIAKAMHIKNGDHGLSVFSGSSFIQDRLVFGDLDLDSINIIKNDEPVGNYSYLAASKNNNTIVCGTDYFGISKLYYMQTDHATLVSNNYHLLLLLARDLDLPLEIDSEKVAATLVFASIQPFHQNFTRRMDVRPVNVLPADKFIEVKGGAVRLLDSTLACALSQPPDYSHAAYEALMNEARAEILSHVQAVLEHAAFDHVICDLSGGMDSRLVFCALTNFPHHAQRIRVNSHYSAVEPNDLVVAQEVASFYEFEFDSLPREKVIFNSDILASKHWSYCLGQYYSYTPIVLGARIPKAARLNGFYGEICARPYYSRRMFASELDVDSVELFCEEYFSRFQKSAISESSSCINSLKRLFSEELSLIPGRTVLEKFDNHYMFYRNGLHCSDRFRLGVSCPEFGPIQSKALSKAKIMGYQEFRSAKTQFDMLNLMNPALASLRYESDFDNADLNSVRKHFGILGAKWSENLRLTPRNVEEKWQAAKDSIVVKEALVDAEESGQFSIKYRKFYEEEFGLALPLLRELGDGGIIVSQELIRAIWFMFSRSDSAVASRSVRWNVLNRLVSLHTQMRIVGFRIDSERESRDEAMALGRVPVISESAVHGRRHSAAPDVIAQEVALVERMPGADTTGGS